MVDDDVPSRGPRAAPGAATVPGTGPHASPPTPPVDPLTATAMTEGFAIDGEQPLGVLLPAAGYQLKDVIGKGGMGEVLAAQDQRIGREVAFKRMRGPDRSAGALARFLREARIQARLDHPAIVPVYELGTDAEGLPYFTMKRLSGVTLAQRLADPPPALQPLLRAFIDVCLAVELAHSRGVVHRDLKPSNIMLGDFGEVYVLDWGVARVIASRRRPTERGEDDADAAETQHGSMLGTPGYMAPEQMRDSSSVGPAADVYALGVILFEILAGEPLHPRGHAALASTLTGEHTGPAVRAPGRTIAPELDLACSDAIADEPAVRPTARVLAERVQQYLDGDRDLERRRAMAKQLLASAHVAVASGDPARRGEAVHAAGRALALDTDSVEAAELVTRLLVEPPAQRPAELEQELAELEIRRTKSRGKYGAIAYTLLLACTLLVPFMHVQQWTTLLAMWFAILVNLALGVVTMRTGVARTRYVVVTSMLMILAVSRLASPLILVPAIACGTTLSVASTAWMSRRVRRIVVWTVAVGMLPFVLEWIGVFATTAVIEPDQLVIRSNVFQTSGAGDLALLILTNLVFLVIVAVFTHQVVGDRRRAEREVEIQAWHLRKLLPSRAGTIRRS
ncbi:MAG: serine/threonine protein kinase [Myxococcota bacterium]|nr:serine/threonine protein kinase [Myxococcota bacterium]